MQSYPQIRKQLLFAMFINLLIKTTQSIIQEKLKTSLKKERNPNEN